MVEREAGAGGGTLGGRVAAATAAGFGGWGNPPRAPARMWLGVARVRLGGATGAELGARRALWPSRRTVSAPSQLSGRLGSLRRGPSAADAREDGRRARSPGLCCPLPAHPQPPRFARHLVRAPLTCAQGQPPRLSQRFHLVAFLPAVSCLTSGKLAAFQRVRERPSLRFDTLSL